MSVWLGCGIVILTNCFFIIDGYTCIFNKSVNLNVDLITIYTFDFARKINSMYLLNESVQHIFAHTRNERPINLYIPGYNETIDTPNQHNIRENLKHDPKTYLFIVDHRNYTNADLSGDYGTAVQYYWSIGKAIALFIKALVKRGTDLGRITVVGHSLGSQIAGAVGEVYVNETGTLLPKIRGSDPAGPCFDTADNEYQLRAGLAKYVEIYHCNKGKLGTANNLSDVLFFVNGGEVQPGCPKATNDTDGEELYVIELCSHNTCPIVLTLPAKVCGIWKATACNSEENYSTGACDRNSTTMAGILSSSHRKGTYYFNTMGYNVTPPVIFLN